MIVQIAAAMGGDVTGLAQRAGFDLAAATDPDARIPLDVENALWDAAAELVNDPAFGLNAATRLRPGMFDVLDYAQGGDRQLLGDVGRGYLKALSDVRIEDFSRFDADTMKKLSGFDQTRGKIRDIMKNVHYPDGFFYVERTLILLFGLVGRLAPKIGLPGLIGPFAMQAFAGKAPAVAPPSEADEVAG